jgi:hypothetical protein
MDASETLAIDMLAELGMWPMGCGRGPLVPDALADADSCCCHTLSGAPAAEATAGAVAGLCERRGTVDPGPATPAGVGGASAASGAAAPSAGPGVPRTVPAGLNGPPGVPGAATRAPHWLQNRASEELLAPQDWQNMTA